ncbi:hypothetical protein PHLGIDRAFT_31782 [Phlebiopsis gigantea 11061_1 CR5-6]|uniref:Uncharacterized protein n=1 Tax=Phlebiopsis gigantea (strain 11061_1 CR5-6) TaxID=745531 RepID=A0A0C3NFK2_PHLG1|nr:hypothetical protein PHLGIDRAFT_31782 [Phlebiopsis gigantea 11061_1 CR5-6]
MVSIEASDTDEPLATRRKHITFTLPEGLKRARSRSPSVPLSNQRRKVAPTSALSADPSSKAPSNNGPRVVSSTPREYSVASFDSGTHIYSPVQSNFEPAPAHHPQQLNVSNAPPRKRSSKGSSRSKATYSKISWQSVGVVVPTEERLAQMPLFTEDSVVLGFARGQPSGIWKPTSFEFELDEGMFKALSLWTNRNDHEEDLSNARCLSLACHVFSDCVDALKRSVNCVAKKDLFTDRPVEWPPFPPSVCINDGQTRERRFAISSWVTDLDHIADISKRVQPGRNIVQLLRPLYPSPSVNYVFVLRFHPPTPRQSAEVMKRRGDSLAWGQFLDRCSHIDIPDLDYEIPDL